MGGRGGAGRDALFPLTWGLPVPHSQANGVSWVQAGFSRNTGKLGSTGNQPVGDWRESLAETLIQPYSRPRQRLLLPSPSPDALLL